MTRALVAASLAIVLVASNGMAQTSPADPAQPTSPTDPAQTTVDASRGGITIASGVNSLTNPSSMDAGTGVGVEDDALSQFDFYRLRVSLSGGMFRARAGPPGTAELGGSPGLRPGVVRYPGARADDAVILKPSF